MNRMSWWQAMIFLLAAAAAFALAFIILSLLIHGGVKWS